MKSKKFLVAVVVALIFCLCVIPSYAYEADVYPLPHSFYGDLSINNVPAPIGTVVESKGQGVVTTGANPFTTTQVGKYGNVSGLEPRLNVQGDLSNGTVLTFWVNGIQADQTFTFTEGESSPLNLTVSHANLTVESSDGGSVTTPGEGTFLYSYGETINLVAEPQDACHQFTSWTGDVADPSSPNTTVFIDGSKTVKANFEQIQYNLTVFGGPQGYGTVAGSGLYPCSTNAQIVATPTDANYYFITWEGEGIADPSSPDTTVLMNGNKIVLAVFGVNSYTLDVTVTGNGTVAKDPDSSTYNPGASVELTATADAGWTFSGWSGDLGGNTNPASITMDSNKAVTATFTQDEYTLTINKVGNGTVTKAPDQATYHYGDVVTLSAVADAGWTFTGFDASMPITMDSNKTVTATFTQNVYTLTIDIIGNGTVTPDMAGPYHYGNIVTLSAVADSGWEFAGFSDNVVANKVTITSNTTVTATFSYVIYSPVSLCTGWNTFSTPVTLDAEWNTWLEFLTKNDLNIDTGTPSYFYNGLTAVWEQVMGSYLLVPCDAIYIKMAGPDTAIIVPSSEPDTLPTKLLYAGWNLISMAATENMAVNNALISIYYVTGETGPWGYSQVISPQLPCQTGWVYIRDSNPNPVPEMEIGKGYWVYMVNSGTLAGFTITPQ